MPKVARVDFSDVTLREKLRQCVDPQEMVDTLVGIMRDPQAPQRDRLAAIKQIADRRDGLPVGMVVTGHVSIDHAFAELPDTALAQLEAIVAHAQATQLKLASGDGYDDDDEL